jgi:preprotein translocase subunit SecG
VSLLLTVVHVTTAVLLIIVVLLQSGKGAEISASFGGSSQTVFGSSGGANFFVKFTSVAAAIFMFTSLALTIVGSQSRKSLFEETAAPVRAAVPVSSVAPVTTAAPAASSTAPATAAASGQSAVKVPADKK